MTHTTETFNGRVYFNGNLIDQICTISVGGAVSPIAATVTLPTVSASLLDVAGKTAGRTSFIISLSNCSGPAASTHDLVLAYFESGPDVAPISGELINRGDATNVRLQLLNIASQPLKVGDPSQLTENMVWYIRNGKAQLPYSVQYKATGVATSGTVVSTVTYVIDYQ